MPRPVSQWTEQDVLSLPLGENNSFERKGSRKLDLTIPGVKEGEVLDELAKQLSAFANSGGGQIVYGVNDNGSVDQGGVCRTIKGLQSTREWLEDVVPALVDFELVNFNVYEIRPPSATSGISPNKSLYVVEVEDSERAPHQSNRDLKYYVRVGGKSRPAPHRLIEDIRNRSRHPKIEIRDLNIVSVAGTFSQGVVARSISFEAMIQLRMEIENTGTILASNTCLQISASISLATTSFKPEAYSVRQSLPGSVLIEMDDPSYPGMNMVLDCILRLPAKVEVNEETEAKAELILAGQPLSDIALSISIYADSAPVRKQQRKLVDLDQKDHFSNLVRGQVENIRRGF
jgi:hypothetical protein